MARRPRRRRRGRRSCGVCIGSGGGSRGAVYGIRGGSIYNIHLATSLARKFANRGTRKKPGFNYKSIGGKGRHC